MRFMHKVHTYSWFIVAHDGVLADIPGSGTVPEDTFEFLWSSASERAK